MSSSEWRVALVGCGVISPNHLGALRDISGVTVVALCDVKRERAAARRDEYCPDAAIYTDYIEMLDKEKPDAVHICTPHYLHADMAIHALARDVNVFLEKPACMTEDEIQHLLEAEKASRGRICVCFQNRTNAAVVEMRRLIEAYGGREAIAGCRAMVSWHRDARYYSDDWHGKMATEGGGVLINQAIHTLDLLLYLCGEPEWVEASVANRHLAGVTEVEDSADLCYGFGGDKIALFHGSTAYVTDSPNFLEVLMPGHTLVLYGSALFDNCEPVVVANHGEPMRGKICYGVGHAYIIPAFYDALASGAEMPVALSSAMHAVRVLLAAYRSENRRIDL